MQKKIALVTNSTWNIYNFRQGLIKRLHSEGYEIIVIAPVDEYIHYLNESYFTKHIPLKHLAPQSKNPAKDLLLTKELYQIYKKESPDLILHYTIKPNIFGSIAAKLTGLNSISTITGLGYTFLNKGLTNSIVKRLYRYAFQKLQKVIFHNSDDRQLFLDNRIIKEQQAKIIPGSGVNTNYFRPLSVTANQSKFVFLFIGRLLYDKGIIEFVKAAKQLRNRLPKAEFWVVGESEAKNPSLVSKSDLLQWVEGQFIHYLGPTNEIRKYIKKADVVVLPSYREGMPRAILEGMAMGKPVITTDTAGCKETVDGNGIIVPVKNAAALANAMEKIYHLDGSAFKRMSLQSRRLALEVFDEKIIIDQYLEIIQAICPVNRTKPKSTNAQIDKTSLQ